MICKLFLQVILDDEIQMIRVPFSHGALCRTDLFESAGRLVLPMQNYPKRGLTTKLRTVNSRTNDWASDSARCSHSCLQVQATASHWSARTGQTRKPRTVFSITIESARWRFWAVTFRRRVIAPLRPTDRSW